MGAAPGHVSLDYNAFSFDSTQRTRQRQRKPNKQQRVNDNPVNVDGHPNQEEVAFACFSLSRPLLD